MDDVLRQGKVKKILLEPKSGHEVKPCFLRGSQAFFNVIEHFLNRLGCFLEGNN